MTIINWIFAKVCYFILFIGSFSADVVDNWTCEDMSRQESSVMASVVLKGVWGVWRHMGVNGSIGEHMEKLD